MLEEKYLFTEVLPKPNTLLEQLYFSCSRESNKAMLEKIEEISAGSREYKEYMEGWVHEIKNPVTAMKLFVTIILQKRQKNYKKKSKSLMIWWSKLFIMPEAAIRKKIILSRNVVWRKSLLRFSLNFAH